MFTDHNFSSSTQDYYIVRVSGMHTCYSVSLNIYPIHMHGIRLSVCPPVICYQHENCHISRLSYRQLSELYVLLKSEL